VPRRGAAAKLTSSRLTPSKYQQPAFGSQQQYYQWPVTNSGQTTQHTYSTAPRSIPYQEIESGLG